MRQSFVGTITGVKCSRKLTREDIDNIRAEPDDITLRELAFKYDVNHKTIYYWKTELNRKSESRKNAENKKKWIVRNRDKHNAYRRQYTQKQRDEK